MSHRDSPPKRPRQRWGHCQLCDVSLYSEEEAHIHVRLDQHLKKEMIAEGRDPTSPGRREPGSPGRRDDRDRDQGYRGQDRLSFENKRNPFAHNQMRGNRGPPTHVWVIGTAEMDACRRFALDRPDQLGRCLGLLDKNIQVHWYCRRQLKMNRVDLATKTISRPSFATNKVYHPNMVILHVGGYDLRQGYDDLTRQAKDTIRQMHRDFPRAKIVWSQLLPRFTGNADTYDENKDRVKIDDEMASYVLETKDGAYIRHPEITLEKRQYYKRSSDGDLNLSESAISFMVETMVGAIQSILFRGMKICPDLVNLTEKVNKFVGKNIAYKQKPHPGPRNRSEHKFQFDSWKTNPEEIPKRSDYYEHDNRSWDDMNFWERKQMYLKTGRYPADGPPRGGATPYRGRGRGAYRGDRPPRGRGNFRGSFSYSRGRGGGFKTFRESEKNPYFQEKWPKFGSSAGGDWKHDKFSELEDNDGGDGDNKESHKSRDKEDRRHRHDDSSRERKSSKSGKKEKDYSDSKKKGKEKRGEKRSGEKEADEIRKEEENMKIDVNVELN